MKKNKILICFVSFLSVLIILVSCGVQGKQQIKTLTGETIDEAAMDAFIDEQMGSLNIKGISIVIINDGKVVYHRAKGLKSFESSDKINKETLFEAASISKPIFAWFVMKQVEKGLLNLDTPLYKYLPYQDIEHDERYKLITARMILCHISGFPNIRYFNPDHRLDIKFTPGTKFLYSGEGYLYLSKVIAHLNGLDLSNLDSLFQKEVARELGLGHAYFKKNKYVDDHLASGHKGDSIVYDPHWDRYEFSAAGGLISEALSYANFLIAIMENHGLKIESYDEILKEHIKLPDGNTLKTVFGVCGWGLGFALTPSARGFVYSHAGNNLGYTAGFSMNREAKFGYVFLTNSDQRNDLHKNLDSLLIKKRK